MTRADSSCACGRVKLLHRDTVLRCWPLAGDVQMKTVAHEKQAPAAAAVTSGSLNDLIEKTMADKRAQVEKER